MERPNINEASITDFIVERNRHHFEQISWEGSYMDYLN